MTRKVYKSAMGKPVDMGGLLLQNEQVRAVGNMGVNAAGDLIDSSNKVIDQRNRQVQRQYKKQTNVSDIPVATGTLSARKSQEESKLPSNENKVEQHNELVDTVSTATETEIETNKSTASGGLAAAIARNREIKQELEKTMRQRNQEKGIRPI
jgi:hypothetical protein